MSSVTPHFHLIFSCLRFGASVRMLRLLYTLSLYTSLYCSQFTILHFCSSSFVSSLRLSAIPSPSSFISLPLHAPSISFIFLSGSLFRLCFYLSLPLSPSRLPPVPLLLILSLSLFPRIPSLSPLLPISFVSLPLTFSFILSSSFVFYIFLSFPSFYSMCLSIFTLLPIFTYLSLSSASSFFSSFHSPAASSGLSSLPSLLLPSPRTPFPMNKGTKTRQDNSLPCQSIPQATGSTQGAGNDLLACFMDNQEREEVGDEEEAGGGGGAGGAGDVWVQSKISTPLSISWL